MTKKQNKNVNKSSSKEVENPKSRAQIQISSRFILGAILLLFIAGPLIGAASSMWGGLASNPHVSVWQASVITVLFIALVIAAFLGLEE